MIPIKQTNIYKFKLNRYNKLILQLKFSIINFKWKVEKDLPCISKNIYIKISLIFLYFIE